MTSFAADPFVSPDFFCIFGQSNVAQYGDPMSAFPQPMRYDASVGISSEFIPGDWHKYSTCEGTAFGSVGTSAACIGAQARYVGMNPAIYMKYQGGVSSADLLTIVTTGGGAARAGQVLGLLSRVKSKFIVWIQGEAEEIALGPGLWIPNTTSSVAAIRAAIGSDAHLIIVQLPSAYTQPGAPGAKPYSAVVRGEQATLAASDGNASIVCVGTADTLDGTHWNAATQIKTAALVAKAARAHKGSA